MAFGQEPSWALGHHKMNGPENALPPPTASLNGKAALVQCTREVTGRRRWVVWLREEPLCIRFRSMVKLQCSREGCYQTWDEDFRWLLVWCPLRQGSSYFELCWRWSPVVGNDCRGMQVFLKSCEYLNIFAMTYIFLGTKICVL